MRFLSFLFFFLSVGNAFSSNSPAYEQRRTAYIDTALAAPNGNKLILQAYRGLPLDAAALQDKLNRIATGQTSDFDIIELVRILYLDSGTYDAQILPVLNSVPFWLNKGDTVRNYWSENHMIMWMSSDWLLHERYGKPVDSRLDARLRHYLQLKVTYGYYEFFSSVYAPYCFSGILNLADFAQDAQIKALATLAAQRLLADILMLTNDKGVFFPPAGRNYPSKYETAYGQNHNNLIYLLTGMGTAPTAASAAGPFLASSSLPVDTVSSTWRPVLDTLYHIGHSLDTGLILNAAMTTTDRTVFQWTSGAYFHPTVVSETVQLLNDSALWDQVDFALLRPLRAIITPQSAPALSQSLGVISKSTVICGEDVAIFKHNSVTLASIQDFWKGKVGFQEHPCVANVGTTAVYTGSGPVFADWTQRSSNNANVHLPYVQQKKNVALLMYRPEYVNSLLGTAFDNKDVALHWKDNDFDEVLSDSLWLLGRQDESYVAVRRSCTDTINGVRACHTNGGQSWVIMVGDSGMYGSFANFQNIIHQSQFEERWYLDTVASQYVYYVKVAVDNDTLQYGWGVDTLLQTGINELKDQHQNLNVFPNPSNESFLLDLSAFTNQQVNIRVLDAQGQQVYAERVIANGSNKPVSTKQWAQGVYLVIADNGQSRITARLVKQ